LTGGAMVVRKENVVLYEYVPSLTNHIQITENISYELNDSTPADSTVHMDVSVYLAIYLGRRHRGGLESAALTFVYCVVLLTGVAGNVATCVVVARNKYMHTATNYYLVSLAVSDALALVFGQ
jgi:7 transmembrane receptor (rhodopsin family)